MIFRVIFWSASALLVLESVKYMFGREVAVLLAVIIITAAFIELLRTAR